MKTVHNHTIKANSLSAWHSSYSGITITAVETDGNVENRVEIQIDPAELKRFLQKSGRNALIDAKVLRGKRAY